MSDVFSTQLEKLFPEGQSLDPILKRTFNWMEAQGWMGFREDGNRPENYFMYVMDPEVAEQSLGASHVVFGGTDLKYTGHWSAPNPEVDKRIIEIATTSGDGGRAAVWIDGEGQQAYVHLGHDDLGLISRDPLTLLSFLAMGYIEPGGGGSLDLTPEENFFEYYGAESMDEVDEDELLIPPKAFQDFLRSEFGVNLPATAKDLGIAPFEEYLEEDSKDPFASWLNSMTPPPTEEELQYIRELEQMAKATTKDMGKDPSLFDRIKNLIRR